MKSKLRVLWMRLHAYIACFFLPAAMLYALTGGLYLLGIEGGVRQEYHYQLELEAGWPKDQMVAEKIVTAEMCRQGHCTGLPEDYYLWEGKHDWYGFKREVLLIPEADGQVTLEIREHDLWHQLLLIHKGHAGKFLKVFAILWGISLLFSLVSGVVLALNMPKIKRMSMASLVAGSIVLLAAFTVG